MRVHNQFSFVQVLSKLQSCKFILELETFGPGFKEMKQSSRFLAKSSLQKKTVAGTHLCSNGMPIIQTTTTAVPIYLAISHQTFLTFESYTI